MHPELLIRSNMRPSKHALRSHRSKRCAGSLVAGCMLLMMSWMAGGATSDKPARYISDEHAVLTALLYNFLLFVDWPAANSPDKGGQWHICSVGDDPIVNSLDALSQRPARGYPIRVQRLTVTDTADRCHILYISADHAEHIPEVLARVADGHVLTIAESEGFVERGGMILLMRNGEQLRIGVNMASLRTAGLTISTRLLALPQVVRLQEPP
jgi:hypothetical protein